MAIGGRLARHRRDLRFSPRNVAKCGCAEPFEVDHFFPIKAQDLDGNDVGCGLHVPWNLVIEPRSKNRSRGSRVIKEGKIIK